MHESSYGMDPPPASTVRVCRAPRPTPEQPGTLLQQFQVIALSLENPWGLPPDEAFQAARRTILPHARRRYDQVADDEPGDQADV